MGNKKQKSRRTSVRVEKELDNAVISHMNISGLKDWSKALHSLFRKKNKEIEKLRKDKNAMSNEIEGYKHQLMLETPKVSNVDCIFLEGETQCFRDFLKKGIIRDTNRRTCARCLILQQEQRQREKMANKAKSKRTEKPARPTLYKRGAKIQCLQDGEYIHPLKNLGKCRKCNLHYFSIWQECQLKQREEIYMI